jgi:hypothetical protein
VGRPSHKALPGPRQHELVSLWIHAHRQMRWFFPFGLRFPGQLTTTKRHFPPAYDYVRHLKGQTCPSSFPFPTAMDSDRRSAYGNLGNHIRLLHYLTAEHFAVKLYCAFHVKSPDYILHALYLHRDNAKQDILFAPGFVRVR